MYYFSRFKDLPAFWVRNFDSYSCFDSCFSVEGKFLHVTTRVWSLALLKVIIRMVFFHDATFCPFFVRPLRQLEVDTVCSLCVAFEYHSFLEVILK
jgi:hypothetical protein